MNSVPELNFDASYNLSKYRTRADELTAPIPSTGLLISEGMYGLFLTQRLNIMVETLGSDNSLLETIVEEEKQIVRELDSLKDTLRDPPTIKEAFRILEVSTCPEYGSIKRDLGQYVESDQFADYVGMLREWAKGKEKELGDQIRARNEGVSATKFYDGADLEGARIAREDGMKPNATYFKLLLRVADAAYIREYEQQHLPEARALAKIIMKKNRIELRDADPKILERAYDAILKYGNPKAKQKIAALNKTRACSNITEFVKELAEK